MDVYNQSEHKLPKMRSYKLFTLRWRSFSGCGRENVALVFPSKPFQYLTNGCRQPIGKWITQDAKLRIVDAPLTLILGMQQGAFRCLLCLYRLPTYRLCITVTKVLCNTCTYKTTNHWRSVDAHFNVLSIQHLLPSIIVSIMIWTYW